MTGGPSQRGSSPLVYMIAGELSGDVIGGALMSAIKTRTGNRARFAGVGGDAMAAEGLESVFPMDELSIFELHEILFQLPQLLGRLKQVADDIRRMKPSVLVTIDCPKFSLRVARRVRDLGIPLVHYVAPTVYAYAPRRADAMAEYLDHLLLLFPFEKPYFDAVGLPTTYVGPHILESPFLVGDGARFRRRHGIPDDAELLCVLPGSRSGEIRNMLPVFDKVVRILGSRFPRLRIVTAVTPKSEAAVRATAVSWPGSPICVSDAADKMDAMSASNVALSKTGSVTLELAAAGVPTVIGARVFPLSWIQAVRGVTLTYVCLPNWILDRQAVPEFVQPNCRPRPIADAVARLLTDRTAADRQRADLAEVMNRLRVDQARPSDRAADAIMQLMSRADRDVA
jgi:lipid-A-disaccharide synthase